MNQACSAEGTSAQEFRDDPSLDFRGQYYLPYHFIWEHYYPDHLANIDYEGYVSAALDLLPPAPCEVLDVGCGDGCVAAKAHERGYRVVGVDYSDRAVAFSKLMVPEGEFHVRDVRTLHEDSSLQSRFQAAYFVEVLEHIPPEYQVELLKRIRGCLVDGGLLVLTVPSIHQPLTRFHYKHFTKDEVIALLEESGFRVQTVVNQCAKTFLRSRHFWRLFYNRYYDLRRVRSFMRRLLINRYNTTENPGRARRYIFAATKC